MEIYLIISALIIVAAIAGILILYGKVGRLAAEKSTMDARLASEEALGKARLATKEGEIGLLKESHEKEVSQLREAHGKELQQVRESHNKETEQLKASHDKEIAQLRTSHEREIAQLKASNDRILKQVETSQKEAIDQIKENHAESMKKMESEREEDFKQMKEVFENLSSKNSEEFKERSAKTISELMQPVQEKFREFSEAVKTSQEKSIERHASLEQTIKDLNERSDAIGKQANNLADALTGHSKMQGDFGEMLLKDVLVNAGLTEGIHFKTQSVITDEAGREIKSESGKTMIPDVIVFYPDNTLVIIDSKMSLKAYNDYVRAEGSEERIRLAKAHVKSVKNHVDELKGKDYNSYIPAGMQKVSYNIMFIPIEGAYNLMLETEPTLWQVARDNNVLIVSQMNLIIVLNMIQMGWKQFEQEKNTEQVYKVASEMMSQLKNWMGSFVDIGKSLEKAGASYTAAKMALVDSKQSAIRKIEKLERLGLKPRHSNSRISTGKRTPEPATIIPPELKVEEELSPEDDQLLEIGDKALPEIQDNQK